MMQATGCDGVMIARGALGDPWLFERVNAAIEGLPAPKVPKLQARMNALRRQVEELVEQKGEFVAMPQARSPTMHYMKGLKGAANLRRYCCTLTHLEDLDELIDAVFEEQRKAGIDPDDVREVPFPVSYTHLCAGWLRQLDLTDLHLCGGLSAEHVDLELHFEVLGINLLHKAHKACLLYTSQAFSHLPQPKHLSVKLGR